MTEVNLNLSRVNTPETGGVTFGIAHYQARGSCGPRVQGDYQLVAILRGSATVQVGEAHVTIPERHVALMRPGNLEHFRFDRSAETHHTWCAVHPDRVPPGLRERLSACSPLLPLSDRLHGLIEYGLSVPEGPSEGLLAALSLAALEAYAFESAKVGEDARRPEPVQRALLLIETHLHEPLDLDTLAAAGFVTPQHLGRLFREHLGMSPVKYLWARRTRRGVELLRETGLSVAEIAARVGFQSPFHFSRLVREAEGMSPREVRTHGWTARINESSTVR